MTLTTVVGSSGSGKTTFLNDVFKFHKCIYIRQYHSMRSYLPVSKIPNFDPTKLPYWDIYVKEEKANTIKVGGLTGIDFVVGLSGGQRKILLFELISQRIQNQSELLIALDEPFAGVTDDFVPYIVDRLTEMKKRHNVILVTNDHIETLTRMADNTLSVSALDRGVVTIVGREERTQVERQKIIFALSVGEPYHYKARWGDVRFFLQAEVFTNSSLWGIAKFTVFSYAFFLLTFWDSSADQADLVIIAASDIVSFFCINPYILSLVGWRIAMIEESEALLHASRGMNRNMKTGLAILIMSLISIIEYAAVNLVLDDFSDWRFLVAILLDNISNSSPNMFLSIFSSLDLQNVQFFGKLPFLLVILFSTAFSPGSGLPYVRELRYLFARFYFWCMIPAVQDQMEGCPDSEQKNMLYLFLSASLGSCIFFAWQFLHSIGNKLRRARHKELKKALMDRDFHKLQIQLFGRRTLNRFQSVSKGLTTFTHDGNSVDYSNEGSRDSNDWPPPPLPTTIPNVVSPPPKSDSGSDIFLDSREYEDDEFIIFSRDEGEGALGGGEFLHDGFAVNSSFERGDGPFSVLATPILLPKTEDASALTSSEAEFDVELPSNSLGGATGPTAAPSTDEMDVSQSKESWFRGYWTEEK